MLKQSVILKLQTMLQVLTKLQRLKSWFIRNDSQKEFLSYTEFLRLNLGQLIIGKRVLEIIIGIERQNAFADGMEWERDNPNAVKIVDATQKAQDVLNADFEKDKDNFLNSL